MHVLSLFILLIALRSFPPAAAGMPPAPKAKTAASSSAALFRKFNLAPLWLVSARPAEAQTMLGYMGPQSRPFHLVFEKVRRDSKNPALYHVQGKSKERDRILAFRGTITLHAFKPVAAPYFSPTFNASAHYLATGQFRLVESTAQEGAGTFTGSLRMTFSQTTKGLAYQPGSDPWWAEGIAGEGSAFTSIWTSVTHPAPVHLMWATNFMDVAPTVLSHFRAGDRSPKIDRKYRQVGWDSYWSNEEWWSEAEEPTL